PQKKAVSFHAPRLAEPRIILCHCRTAGIGVSLDGSAESPSHTLARSARATPTPHLSSQCVSLPSSRAKNTRSHPPGWPLDLSAPPAPTGNTRVRWSASGAARNLLPGALSHTPQSPETMDKAP